MCVLENVVKGKIMIIDLNVFLINIICDIDGKMYIIENWIGVKFEYFYSFIGGLWLMINYWRFVVFICLL